jgi:hypothetical protein
MSDKTVELRRVRDDKKKYANIGQLKVFRV